MTLVGNMLNAEKSDAIISDAWVIEKLMELHCIYSGNEYGKALCWAISKLQNESDASDALSNIELLEKLRTLHSMYSNSDYGQALRTAISRV